MGGSETGSASPVYIQIAADLRSAIRSGELTDGDRLPGENVLMERYGVARMTARRHGSHRLTRALWGEGGNIWGAGLEDRAVTVDHIRIDEVDADEQLAELLGCAEGTSLLRRSRRYVRAPCHRCGPRPGCATPR